MPNILGLENWKVLNRDHNSHDMMITAEYTAVPDVCVRCGIVAPKLNKYGVQEQTFMDTPIHGKRVGIKVQRQRFRCSHCEKTFQQPLPDMDEKRTMTRRLVDYIRRLSLQRTFTQVSQDVGVNEKTVRNIFTDYVKELDAKYQPETPVWLGIDELFLIRRPRCVLTDVSRHTLIDILEDRNKPTVLDWLKQRPNKNAVEIVTMDMWRPYRDAALAVLPDARVIIDKFHVVKLANHCLDRIRKDLRESMTATERRKLMHDRHLILRRRKDLTAADVTRMHGWTNQLPELKKAYNAKEDFYEIYEKATSRVEALELWDMWRALWEPELGGTFLELIRAVENWRPEVFNYFDNPGVTNAYTEAMNGLTKVANRQGRGYSFEAIRAKMLYGWANKETRYRPPFGKAEDFAGCGDDRWYGVGIQHLTELDTEGND